MNKTTLLRASFSLHRLCAPLSCAGFPARAVSLALITLLTGCAVAPDYQRPDAPLSSGYKESQATVMGEWKAAEPQHSDSSAALWAQFADPLLNDLLNRVVINNQNIQAAEAQFRQAAALSEKARASFFPAINGSASSQRSVTTPGASITTPHTLKLDASWEADVWGRIRRTVESNDATAQASAADLAAARLSAQAALAQNYFQIRVLDEQKRLYDQAAAAYERALTIYRHQYQAGMVTPAEVGQSEALLKATQALAQDMVLQRQQLEHAMAVLLGVPPAEFTLPSQPQLSVQLPGIPLSQPSVLLERRPDIAAAERRMASANAQIGVAKAAWFPVLSLGGSAGYQSSTLANWLTVPQRVWAFGPSLTLPLFDGGSRSAQAAQAQAAFDASVASYRQTVLTALQEVEDNLVGWRILQDETATQQAASDAAWRNAQVLDNQYRAGMINYLTVATATANAITQQRTLTTLKGRQLSTSVALIKSLGGGWQTTGLPGAAPAQSVNKY